MSSSRNQLVIEERFITELRHHLTGLKTKVEEDFSEANYEKELRNLQGDPVYVQFGFDRAEYVLIRFMGRISISIGRRLGEIYDKIPRFVACARYDIDPKDIAPKLNRLELDIGLKFDSLSMEDAEQIRQITQKYVDVPQSAKGIGIEIRYNFNPNDSSRLRKDVTMGEYVQNIEYIPIYLVFSSISPRDEAISRLERGGWNFLKGNEAIDFAEDLFGLDLASILDKPKIKREVQSTVDDIMNAMVTSYAFQAVIQKHT